MVRVFAQTPRLSTYLFTCIAGPYECFVSPRKAGEGYPPMRIFARKSLRRFIEPYTAEFFKITECGVKFYEELFGRVFPFAKHDQIYCPEFNVGAMENAGAVTYTENYAFKEPPTEERMMDFAETILHELSHMWFGDLVTMKWWNGLWLNESFATFISNLCMAIAPGLERYHAAWVSFHKFKGWAYRVDQAPTTHPIAAEVSNTEDAENIFDGITYMKGASVLKQLYYLVSHENFAIGLKDYFKRYEWQNTELKDFIGTMQTALKTHGVAIDLELWTQQWLFTKGLCELRPEFEIHDGLIREFKIHQQPAAHSDPTDRMHMLDVAFYDKDFKMTTVTRVLVESKQTTTVDKLRSLPAPHAVLLNVNDYAYGKVRLDAVSMLNFQQDLSRISDTLTRTMVWRNLWDMVRDLKASCKDFLRLVVKEAAREQVELIFTGALNYAGIATKLYVATGFEQQEETALFNMLMTRLQTEPSVNIKKNILSYAIRFACTTEHLRILTKWIREGTGIPDAVLTQTNRYSIIQKLHESKDIPLAEKQELLAAELKNDKSDQGLRAQKACEAAIPSAENKAREWSLYLDPKADISEHMCFASMSGFISRQQDDILQPYVDKYFEALPEVFAKRPRSYAESFFSCLQPAHQTPAILVRFQALLPHVPAHEKTFSKLILEEIEDIKRCIGAQQLYLA